MKKTWVTALWGVLIAGILIAADQLSKWLAVVYLMGNAPAVLIPNVLELKYTENTGAAFSSFEGKNWLLFGLGIVLACALLWGYMKIPADKKWNKLRAPMLVLLAGAAGNLIDRVARGFVVDFIYFKPINFPKFNLADSYIVCSLIFLFILICFVYKDGDLEELRPKGWGKAKNNKGT